MEGRVLGFDKRTNEGALRGADGNRYNFTTESWKSDQEVSFDMLVDFEISEKNAINIYPIKDRNAEDNKVILGVVSLLITLFLGFLGTLISRMAISRHSFSESAFPVFIHFIITLFWFIPVLGWVLYLIGTAYFMIKNYQYVQNPRPK
jgi:hypothetical protein